MNKRYPGMAAPLHQRAPRRMLPMDPRSERDNGAGGAAEATGVLNVNSCRE